MTASHSSYLSGKSVTADGLDVIVIDSIPPDFGIPAVDMEGVQMLEDLDFLDFGPVPVPVQGPTEDDAPKPKRRGVNKFKSTYGPPNRRR